MATGTGGPPTTGGSVSLPGSATTTTTTSATPLPATSPGHDTLALRSLIAEEIRRLSSPSGSIPRESLVMSNEPVCVCY